MFRGVKNHQNEIDNYSNIVAGKRHECFGRRFKFQQLFQAALYSTQRYIQIECLNINPLHRTEQSMSKL